MGIADIGDDDFPVNKRSSVQDLIDEHGEEIVRRALEYMFSLKEADQNYRESAQESDGYSEEFVESYTGEEQADEQLDDAWSKSMEERGLGLDEE